MIKKIRRFIQRQVYTDARFVRKEINGHLLVIDTQDPWMKNNLLYCDVYEPETTRYIEENVQEHDTVLDIGAHIGYHSLNFNRGGADIFAFEPDHKTFALLEKNTEDTSILPLRKVVSDFVGDIVLYKSRGGSAWNSILPIRDATPVIVQSVRIDDYNFSNVKWAKIDVEGAEIDVLYGMIQTIARSPNLKIILEWLPKNQGNLSGILDFLVGWKCRPLDHNMLFWKDD